MDGAPDLLWLVEENNGNGRSRSLRDDKQEKQRQLQTRKRLEHLNFVPAVSLFLC
jgi:hypothetical protein